jgi:mono/diheme cytochrome c family protein
MAGIVAFVWLALAFTDGIRSTWFEKGIPIPYQPQYPGNAPRGYDYLVNGDYLKSGLPLKLFNLTKPRLPDYLRRTGDNAGVPYAYNIIRAPNGARVAAPNCLYCHAQVFEDSLVMGLGNSLLDFSVPQHTTLQLSALAYKVLASKPEQVAGNNLLQFTSAASPYMVTASRGVNIADRLTAVLAAHRDPASFRWIEKPALPISKEVIPSDVPAWWLLKKKHGMFYTGFGRGDFPRFLMAANLLTVNDTAEAAAVLPHFDDVLAYLYTLEPPKYPRPIDATLAARGEAVFLRNCSPCHGTYGQQEQYPNLLIPSHIIQTDSALAVSNFSDPAYIQWFEKSWFRMGRRKAALVPFKGYIAPPLDGVWITAPYLHNGSVPDLESLLDSRKRPTYWERDFKKPAYNYETLGWTWQARSKASSKGVYNTTLRGYGNGGHTFGDKLSASDRRAVIEYLKTL